MFTMVLGNNNDEFRLVPSKKITKIETRSRYAIDESKNMCDMCVKMTYTFSTIGSTIPIFISIFGLTECKLFRDSCIFLKIKVFVLVEAEC